MQRLLTAALLAATLSLAVPANASVYGENLPGTWHWQPEGLAVPHHDLPATALVFLGDDGAFFYRVHFDPAQTTYAQCLNGAGFLASVAGPPVPLDSCALAVAEGVAYPSLTLSGRGAHGAGAFPLA